MPTLPLVAVQGTWGRTQLWWRKDSPWFRFMLARCFRQATTASGLVFGWGTQLGSSWKFWRHWWPGDDMVVEWQYAAVALAIFLDAMPEEDRIVVAHSHGGQVALIASTMVRIHRLVTVATPLRHDIPDRGMINGWFHVCDREGDWTGYMGSLGDGRIDGSRTQPQADRNVLLEGIGHSGLLRDPALFSKWEDQALLAFLRS